MPINFDVYRNRGVRRSTLVSFGGVLRAIEDVAFRFGGVLHSGLRRYRDKAFEFSLADYSKVPAERDALQ
jgi:hypothetical protein